MVRVLRQFDFLVALIAAALLLLASKAFPQELWYAPNDQLWIKDKWPKAIPFPKDVAFYRTAKTVQRSAVTDFPQEGRLNVLTVGTLARPFDEWRIPGGLRGAPRSQWVSYQAVTWKSKQHKFDKIDPAAGAFGGRLRRVSRWFDEGTVFFDLLLNADLVPFELRSIEARGDRGHDFVVMYRDADAAPAGYARPKRAECAACHSRTGEVAYATGNLPGGGGVFSFPVFDE